MSLLPPSAAPLRDSAGTVPRFTSARQTLGSNHDAPEAASAASAKLGADLDPCETVPVWWSVFKDRCAVLGGEGGRTATRIIHHVEGAWPYITELHAACERHRAFSSPGTRFWHLVAFVHDGVVAAFWECAERAAALLGSAAESRSADSVCASAFHFDQALSVATLASQTGQVPQSFASVILPAADALTDWGAESCTLATAFARLLDQPAQ